MLWLFFALITDIKEQLAPLGEYILNILSSISSGIQLQKLLPYKHITEWWQQLS